MASAGPDANRRLSYASNPAFAAFIDEGTREETTLPASELGNPMSLEVHDGYRLGHEIGDIGPSIATTYDDATGKATSFTTRVDDDEYAITTIREYESSDEDSRRELNKISLRFYEDGVGHTFGAFIDEGRGEEWDNSQQQISDGIDDDSLDPYDGDVEDIRPTRVPERQTTHPRLGRRSNEKTPNLDDEGLMQTFLQKYRSLLLHLREELPGQPYLRMSHIFQYSRTFGFSSAVLKSGETTKRIVSVIWQTRARPRQAVSVSFSVDSGSGDLVAVCSCCPLRRQRAADKDNCYHTRACFAEHMLTAPMRLQLSNLSGEEQNEGMLPDRPIFGQEISVSNESGGPRNLRLTCKPVNLFIEMKRRRQGSRLGRRWRFELVFDTKQGLFVPVLKIEGRATQCMLCRGSPERRGKCIHEEACKGRNRMGQNVIDPQQDVEMDEDSDESEWDTEDEREDLPNRSTSGSYFEETDEYYPTKLTRSILPCLGEKRLMEVLCDIFDKESLPFLDERNMVHCRKCDAKFVKSPEQHLKRRIRVFTLTQGTPEAEVYDWYCDKCLTLNRFLRGSYAVFPAGKTCAYSTELMYLWFQLVCVLGMSFRTAYKTTNLITNAVSVTHRMRQAFPSSLDRDQYRSRRRASNAFYRYIQSLDTGGEVVTNRLFSCPTCEVPLTSMDCEEYNIFMAKQG